MGLIHLRDGVLRQLNGGAMGTNFAVVVAEFPAEGGVPQREIVCLRRPVCPSAQVAVRIHVAVVIVTQPVHGAALFRNKRGQRLLADAEIIRDAPRRAQQHHHRIRRIAQICVDEAVKVT